MKRRINLRKNTKVRSARHKIKNALDKSKNETLVGYACKRDLCYIEPEED